LPPGPRSLKPAAAAQTLVARPAFVSFPRMTQAAPLQTVTVVSHGTRIECLAGRGAGPAVLLLHGNSACKEVFAGQFGALRRAGFRVIAPDFPGHGGSDDAADPQTLYSFAGLAALTLDLLDQMHAPVAHVVGWSLGGHAGIELLGRALERVLSLTLIGAPPVAPTAESLSAAFLPSPAAALAVKPAWSDTEAREFAAAALGGPAPPELLAAFRRADGRARAMIIGSALAGAALDETQIIRAAAVPIAVIQGAIDPLVSLQYIRSLEWSGLWGGEPFVVDDAGHAPHWEKPDHFNDILLRFLAGYGAGIAS
jgi:pimeloyl-ACP methyl ester carboxylesterase